MTPFEKSLRLPTFGEEVEEGLKGYTNTDTAVRDDPRVTIHFCHFIPMSIFYHFLPQHVLQE